jgi:hypothetical protein
MTPEWVTSAQRQRVTRHHIRSPFGWARELDGEGLVWCVTLCQQGSRFVPANGEMHRQCPRCVERLAMLKARGRWPDTPPVTER